MNREKAISILNELLEINNDRIEGYSTAIDQTEDTDLKRIFINLKETSQKCKLELEQEIVRCGGKPTQKTKATGKMFRTWMGVQSALAHTNRRAILNSCEQGEDVAVSTYEDVLNYRPSENLSPDQIRMIDEQYQWIKTDHDFVRSLRNTALTQ